MKATKLFKYIGILFIIVGLVTGVGIIAGSLHMQQTEGMFMAIFFLLIFCGMGSVFAAIGFNMEREEKQVLESGSSYLGKILDYSQDRRILINGAPALALVVRYYQSGEIREAVINTGEANPSIYPLGSTVEFHLYNGKAALVPGSVSRRHLDREDDLLNPDFNPNVNVSSIGVKCPNCGANITVPYGMSRICPYCSSKITVDKEGRIVNSLHL